MWRVCRDAGHQATAGCPRRGAVSCAVARGCVLVRLECGEPPPPLRGRKCSSRHVLRTACQTPTLLAAAPPPHSLPSGLAVMHRTDPCVASHGVPAVPARGSQARAGPRCVCMTEPLPRRPGPNSEVCLPLAGDRASPRLRRAASVPVYDGWMTDGRRLVSRRRGWVPGGRRRSERLVQSRRWAGGQ